MYPVYISKHAMTRGIYKVKKYEFINGGDYLDGIKVVSNEGKTIEFFYENEFALYGETVKYNSIKDVYYVR